MRVLLACVLATGCGAELGEPPSVGGGRDHGGSCNVDLVLGVDNSGSTVKEQAALRDAVPAFTSALGNLGAFRVALVDGCATPATFHTRGASGPCNFAGGHRWIESSSPRVTDELRCVADIDSSEALCSGNNDDEEPLTTAITALEPAFAGPGQPNAGFLRDDALLVVIAITDEDEHPVPGASAQKLYERLVATKAKPEHIVMIGAGGESICDGPYGDAQDAEKLQDVTDMFGARGMFWDLCGGHLDDGLKAAAATIANACGS